MTKTQRLSVLIAIALSPFSYAGNNTYDDGIAAAKEKADLVWAAKLKAEKQSEQSLKKFVGVLNSENALKELPKTTSQGYESEWKRQLYLQRTLNDKRNLDPISHQFGRDSFGNKFDQNTPLAESNNTDFYRNKITSSGGVSYYNNNLVPITDGKEIKRPNGVDTWALYSGQVAPYPKPNGNCDSYGSAATGKSGLLYVRSQSVINVIKKGVTTRIKMTISSFDGLKVLGSYISPQVQVKGSPNKVGESQYFMQNSAAHTFNLGVRELPVKVCIEILNTELMPHSIRNNNFDLDSSELKYAEHLSNDWLQKEKQAGNPYAEKAASSWVDQYKVWTRSLMTKYSDMMWLGI